MAPTHKRLRKYLDDREMVARDLTKPLGIGYSMALKLCRGLRAPSLRLAVKIEAFTEGEIRAADWVPDATIEAA